MTPCFGPFPVPAYRRASCMPIFAANMTAGITGIPVPFAARVRKGRDLLFLPSHPERITAPMWCIVAAAHPPFRAPPPNRALRGATASTSVTASANSPCIYKVSRAFRNARLKAVKPSGRAHCNSNYATGNMLSRQGFPALQPLFESRQGFGLHQWLRLIFAHQLHRLPGGQHQVLRVTPAMPCQADLQMGSRRNGSHVFYAPN
jgi:hypothetical protein